MRFSPLTIRSSAHLVVVFACALLACAGTALAEANHEGWPQIGHHEGHPNNESGVMRGLDGVHNMLLGGGGNDTIYAGNDHVALVYGHGTVYCNGPGLKTLVMRYLPQNRPWKLVGCDHKVIVPYRA